MVADHLRDRVANAVRQVVVGTDEGPPRPMWDAADPNPIAIDSPVRQVHADPAMFIGGVRSLLLQTLHPVTMRAVAEHSDYEHDPLGRLQRTAAFLAATTYGSGTQADEAIRTVRKIHSRVVGSLDDGRAYQADEPRLLGWVHVTEVDSFLRSYQRYGARPLTPAASDHYVADMGIIGTALGVEAAPRNRVELATMLESYRADLAPTQQCRDATRFLFAPQLPTTMLPFYALIFSSAVATLPRWARSMLLLPLAPGIDPLVLRPATLALTKGLRWAGVGTRSPS